MQRKLSCVTAVMLGLVGAPAVATAASVAPPSALNLGSGDVLHVQYRDRDYWEDRDLGEQSAAERRRINQRDYWELDSPRYRYRDRGYYRNRDDWDDRELGRQTAGERARMNQRDYSEYDRPRGYYRDRDYWDDRELGRETAGERARINQRGYRSWEYE